MVALWHGIAHDVMDAVFLVEFVWIVPILGSSGINDASWKLATWTIVVVAYFFSVCISLYWDMMECCADFKLVEI